MSLVHKLFDTPSYILSLYENALRERERERRERERERERRPLLSFSVSIKLAVNICFIINYKIKERGRGTRKNVDRNPISVDFASFSQEYDKSFS